MIRQRFGAAGLFSISMRRPFDRRRPLHMLAGAEQITVQPPMAGGRTIGEAVIRKPLQQIYIIRSSSASAKANTVGLEGL